MWWTPEGERVLRGAEWELFREGLDVTWDMVEECMNDPDLFVSGVEAFDRLQPNQKLALLALVGNALKEEGEPRPKLTAHTEVTVAAIFRHIADQVAFEIDMSAEPEPVEDPTYWRRFVLAACRDAEERDRTEEQDQSWPSGAQMQAGETDSRGGEEREDPSETWLPPAVDSADFDDWEFLVDGLANRILWEDGDYEMGDAFMDAAPSESRARMHVMGIADDYYTAIAPDPTDEELEHIRRLLRSVTGRPDH
jgi:hypothetical protein